MTAVVELIRTMEWIMEGVTCAYRIAERDGLRSENLQHVSTQLEVATHHGGMYQIAWFNRMRTGAKVMHLSSARLLVDEEIDVREMVLNCLASFLQWCQHDVERVQYADAAHHEIRKTKKPKVPTYGDPKWSYYKQAVNAIWRAR